MANEKSNEKSNEEAVNEEPLTSHSQANGDVGASRKPAGILPAVPLRNADQSTFVTLPAPRASMVPSTFIVIFMPGCGSISPNISIVP